MDSAADLVPLFIREFQLCKVASGEVVAILTEPHTRSGYANASAAAAAALGAEVFEISVPRLGWDVPTLQRGIVASVPALAEDSRRRDAIRASLCATDFVVDLIPDTILHVPLREELKDAGVRLLTISEPPDALERMFPTEEIKQHVLAMGARLGGTQQLRVTSDAGTDLWYTFGDSPVGLQYGFADEPGRWDNWPSALIAQYPIDGSARGTVVLQPGAALCHMKRYVQSRVEITIENGYMTSIDGELDAALIRNYLESWNEPEVYAVSHVGLGMHPRAQWTALGFYEADESLGMDARCFQGNFLFSTGPNRWTGRYVEAHLDIAMRDCTVTMDEDVVVAAGSLLATVGAER